MKKTKQYTPFYERVKTDKIPLCERTDLTDKQRSMLFTVDKLYTMSSGGLADSIWAPGNKGKSRSPRRSNNLASSGEQAGCDQSKPCPVATCKTEPTSIKLSPTETPSTANVCIPTAASPPIQSSSMATGIESCLHLSRWSAEQAQAKWEESITITAPDPGQQHPTLVSNNAPYVPPHLRGVGHNNCQFTVEGHRTIPQNTQFNTSLELRNQVQIANELPDLCALQTPQRSKASGAVPLWHISPRSQGKQFPDRQATTFESANGSSISKQNAHNEHPTTFPIVSPFVISGSQEGAFLDFLNKKAAADAQKLALAKVSQPVPTDPASQSIPQSTSRTTIQTPPTQPEAGTSRHSHFSTERTDDILEFLLKKEEDLRASGKSYSAVSNSSHRKDTAKEVEYEVQLATTVRNTANEQNVFRQVPVHATCSPNTLGAATEHVIAARTNMHAEATPHQPHDSQGNFVVPRVDPAAYPSAAVSSDLRLQNGTTVIAKVNQTNDNSNDGVLHAAHGWEQSHLLNAKDIKKALLSEIMTYVPPNPDAVRLTEESLVRNTGWAPRVRSEDSFCGRISDAGVERQKENVRASQGMSAAEELLDWDKSWLPPPCDWEGDRYVLDLSFVPKYILEDWAPSVPCGPALTVDISAEGFRLGRLPVNDRVLGDEVIQPDCIPDVLNSENEQKRLRQTAEIDAMFFTKKCKKRNRNAELLAVESEARHMEIAALELAPHPYAPAIPIYLRPVTFSDAPGIRAIYNHYVKKSIIPEDQAEVSDEDIVAMIKTCQQEKLPCIAAIKGNAPLPMSQGRFASPSKPLLPQFELVVGFGFAQTYGYGLGGIRDGRSRTTAELQFYVDQEYTRKGVGRSLLDRLIQSMSHSYAAKDGYDWMNPKDESIYNSGGPKLWHQLIIQLPVEVKDDTTLPWFSEFLAKYWFEQEAKLKKFARSSVFGAQARFLDLVVFAKESSIAMEHPSFL